MSQFFPSSGQSIGVSASASVLPMGIQDWSPLGWTGWISLQSKGLSRVFSNTTVQKHQFFGAQLSLVQLSHPYMTTGKLIAMTKHLEGQCIVLVWEHCTEQDRDSSFPHGAYIPATETDNNYERENEVTAWARVAKGTSLICAVGNASLRKWEGWVRVHKVRGETWRKCSKGQEQCEEGSEVVKEHNSVVGICEDWESEGWGKLYT